ncbi:hypothetical protein [Streptomyces sp. NK08204]|uniref:hypothetical protein n=1 Tax=Streptomyces sp. NK08204 TaxID=2873260 RepID=UPI001CED2639|nr:hypothetical protein [Streptomyces sp. NK08204]
MRNHTRTPLRRAARLAALALGASALLAAVSPQAQADDGRDIPDYQGAQHVLDSGQVHRTVSRFLGFIDHPGDDGGTMGRPMTADSPGGKQQFSVNSPVPLYELAPEFVTGKARPTSADAVRLSYLAAQVTSKDGHHAAVLLGRRSPSGPWGLAGIRDGNEDITFAKRATNGSTVFSEPQIHAWYRLVNNTVEPLNHEARTGFGGRHSMPLAEYQKLVHHRYADKMPGSAYDRKGLAGGYGLASAQPTTHPAGDDTSMLLGGSGAALALAGGTLILRRHRRHAPRS